MKPRASNLRDGFEPSPPQARRWVRWFIWLLLLAVALGAIWWIDRGARALTALKGS